MAVADFTGSDFTIEFPFTTGGGPVASSHLLTMGDPTLLWRVYINDVNTDRLMFELVQSDDTVRTMFITLSTSNIPIDTFVYSSIKMDFTNGLLTWKINDVLRASVPVSTWSGTWKTDANTYFIALNSSVGGANPWVGKLDDLSIHQRAITDDEQSEHYNWWAFDSAGAIYGAVTTVDFDDNFGMTATASSFRGQKQFRQNYRTSDTTYLGLIGDFTVGVPAPVKAPSVSVDVAGDPTALDTDTRFYLMTYVNRLGFESAPGPVTTSPIYASPTSNVTISYPRSADIAYEASAYDSNRLEDYVQIQEARIYRTNTGTSETGFQFVARLSLLSDSDPAATISDVDNDDLGELLVTDNWDVPPPDVTTGCKMASGTYVLAHEYRVHFSVPGVTYAFPILYNRVLKHRALHLESIGSSAILLTDGGPHLIAGASGDTIEVVELPYYQVPTSVRAVSTYMDMVIYPAQDGLIGVDQNGRLVNLTEDIFEEDQWRTEIDLENLISEVYDSTYYGFYKNTAAVGYRGFGLNLKTREWNWFDDTLFNGSAISGMHYDRKTDSFYLANDTTSELLEWQPHVIDFTGLTPITWQWHTKEFIIPQRSYGAVKIMGELDVSNSVEVTYEVDGVDQTLFPIHVGQADGICVSEKPFRLPAIRGQRMKLKLRTSVGAPVVESIQVSVHPMELV